LIGGMDQFGWDAWRGRAGRARPIVSRKVLHNIRFVTRVAEERTGLSRADRDAGSTLWFARTHAAFKPPLNQRLAALNAGLITMLRLSYLSGTSSYSSDRPDEVLRTAGQFLACRAVAFHPMPSANSAS